MKVKQFVYATKNTWVKESNFQFFPSGGMVEFLTGKDQTTILLGEIEIEVPFDMPTHADFNQSQVQDCVREIAKHQNAIDQMLAKINELTAIEDKSGEA